MSMCEIVGVLAVTGPASLSHGVQYSTVSLDVLLLSPTLAGCTVSHCVTVLSRQPGLLLDSKRVDCDECMNSRHDSTTLRSPWKEGGSSETAAFCLGMLKYCIPLTALSCALFFYCSTLLWPPGPGGCCSAHSRRETRPVKRRNESGGGAHGLSRDK